MTVSVLWLTFLTRTQAIDSFAQPGTTAAHSLKNIQECVNQLEKPGDRCLLKAGRYNFNADGCVTIADKQGTMGKPFVLGAAGDGPVIFDGTEDVQELAVDGQWTPVSGSKMYSLKLKKGVEIWQLFADDGADMVMQIPARWPNAGWKDSTMFMGPEHWAHSSQGQHNYSTGLGELYDAGACAADADCCSLCNHNDLAKSGIDASGAMAILQLWANGVGFEKIKKHKSGSNKLVYDATWCKEEVERRGKCGDGYRGGQGKYYLEGSLALLDAPHEWFYDSSSSTLFYYSKTGDKPKNGAVRTKVSVHAVNITGATSHFTIANVTFFASALEAHSSDNSINNVQFESLEFNYPAASRRMLGEISPEKTVLVWTDDNRAVAYDGHKYPAWTNHTFLDVAFRYADGMGLQVSGSGLRFVNCLWEWNSWTGNAASEPNDWGTGGTITVNGLPRSAEPMFERLTLRNNGASKGIRPPHAPGIVIAKCDLGRQLQLAWDGCMVETGSSKSAAMIYNWCHDTGKSALRFDGDDGTGTAHGEMSYNVAWNISGLIIKGDYHKIFGNTVFDAADIDAGKASSTFPGYQDEDSALDYCEHSASVENPGQTTKTANSHTVFRGNLFDHVKAWKNCDNSDCPFAGSWDSTNMVGSSDHADASFPTKAFDIKTELRDPWNRDFRPCPGSAAAAGAGAYQVYSGTEKVYFIPGAKEATASQPSPRNGALKAPQDAELMFLPAFRAVKHNIFVAKEGDVLSKLNTIHGENNIVRPVLAANTAYTWRVDAIFSDGSTKTGETWTFSTSDHTTCANKNAGFVLTSDSCTSAMDDCCSDVKGLGSKCMNHINRHHDKELAPAGCTVSDEQAYCSACGGLPLRNPNDQVSAPQALMV